MSSITRSFRAEGDPTYSVEVTAPTWSDTNISMWVILAIIAALILLPGKEKERK